MNVNSHAVAPGAADSGRNDNEGVLANGVSDAALLLLALATGVRGELELEGVGDTEEQQQAAEALQQRAWGSHGVLAA